MNNKTKETLRLIAYAQAASDGGKYIDDLLYEVDYRGVNHAYHKRYTEKEAMIIKALRLCDHNPESDIHYWVKETPDQNGYASFLVYFDCKVGGERYQVSFHNPYRENSSLKDYAGKGRVTRWRRTKMSSRDSVIAILNYLECCRKEAKAK